jgi:catechol 2,3-dioxygenase-like lactoylglutathione lyase family enzyme
VQVSYAIVFVSDMKRSVSFYRDVIGMPLKFETPGWTEFATGGATPLPGTRQSSKGDGGELRKA